MSWTLSRFRAGELIEIRSKREILATLDEHGCIDGLPFMPEMLRFCGQRVHVRAIAHKTCEVALQTATGRRLRETVHLNNLRCDGSAHGECQAECMLFWKDAWLKRPGESPDSVAAALPGVQSLSEERLSALTQQAPSGDQTETRFACQATLLYGATEHLPWWDLRQYVYDVITGNHSIGRVARVLWLAGLRRLEASVEGILLVGGAVRRFSGVMHRRLTGRDTPTLFRGVQPREKTPTGRLHLQPGERVRVKSLAEIEATLDRAAKNRGLMFDPEEMGPYCGGVYRVHSSVSRIVDEATGRMREMREPCIILEDVVCRAEYARCRLNCPRAIYSYWRELWLERVEEHPAAGG